MIDGRRLHMLRKLKEGDRISVSGYADELGLKDYGRRYLYHGYPSIKGTT